MVARLASLTLGCLLVLSGPSSLGETGNGPDTFHASFTSGDFVGAASHAVALETADGYALAARALIAACLTDPDGPDSGTIEQAIEAAMASVELDPSHLEGRIQLAIGYSLKIRPMSVRDAMSTGLGEASRDLAMSVLADDPNNAWAHGFLSVWNIEVRRRGGRLGAMVLGANLKDARRAGSDVFGAGHGHRPVRQRHEPPFPVLQSG